MDAVEGDAVVVEHHVGEHHELRRQVGRKLREEVAGARKAGHVDVSAEIAVIDRGRRDDIAAERLAKRLENAARRPAAHEQRIGAVVQQRRMNFLEVVSIRS